MLILPFTWNAFQDTAPPGTLYTQPSSTQVPPPPTRHNQASSPPSPRGPCMCLLALITQLCDHLVYSGATPQGQWCFFSFLWYGIRTQELILLGRYSTPWATLPALFFVGYFRDRVSWTICLGYLRTLILLIYASGPSLCAPVLLLAFHAVSAHVKIGVWAGNLVDRGIRGE
jgi:hypothetical protein